MKTFIRKAAAVLTGSVLILTGTILAGTALNSAAFRAEALTTLAADINDYQNAAADCRIVDAVTPAAGVQTSLYWNHGFGSGWSVAPTSPLVIKNSVYTVSGNTLLKLHTLTGKTLYQSAALKGTPLYAVNPPSYGRYQGKDLIFVPIGNGRIQCLQDTGTALRSLWVSEALGGQTTTPVAYKDGCVYSGTWTSDASKGTYFCLDVTDEDTTKTDEVKKAKWKMTPDTDRGFYWAGACVKGDYVIFGSDNGSSDDSSGESILYSVNKETGEIADQKTDIAGAVKSSVVSCGDSLYFVSKGGYLYKTSVDADTGKFTEFTSLNMNGAMTAAPVVYNGRIYVFVSGANKFASDSGHTIAVVNDSDTSDDINDDANADTEGDADANAGSDINDDSNGDTDDAANADTGAGTLEIAYTVTIPGYCQSSPLLSTKAAGSGGKTRVYFTYNALPGGICYIDDAPGQTSGTLKRLYTPTGTLSQYCLSTITAGSNGMLYYKNDSCNVFGIGSTTGKTVKITIPAKKILYVSPAAAKYRTFTLSPAVTADNVAIKPVKKYKVTKGTAYAGVTTAGKVTAKKAGTAVVTVTACGRSATCTVTVKKPVFKLKKYAVTLKKGKTFQINAATRAPVTAMTCATKNKKIATVTAKGKIKAIKKGKTTVTVKCNGITRSVKVTVKIK